MGIIKETTSIGYGTLSESAWAGMMQQLIKSCTWRRRRSAGKRKLLAILRKSRYGVIESQRERERGRKRHGAYK